MPEKVKKYDFEEEEKEENQDIQENENKEGGNQELPSEKMAFKKRLVEKKWFIRGEKDILRVSMEEEIYAHCRHNGC